jgi:general secretion pathway protein A
MYFTFYGIQQNPFHTTPDPEFLYLSPSHKQALGSIIYGVEERKGFIAVTGEVGLGKTTILRAFLSRAGAVGTIIYLFTPHLSFIELLRRILQELNHDPDGRNEVELVTGIQQVLVEEYRKGRTVILLIDEAQNMPMATLENLRMLSNLETSKDKLIQIVLIGQPELNELLQQHELRQLNQRIAVRATISPLSRKQSYAYIKHRLMKAGSKKSNIFTGRALSLIIREAKGNPRVMNILCDNALVTGLGYKKKPVSAGIAKEVIADLNGTTRRWSSKWIPISACIGVCAVLLGWLVLSESEGSWTAAASLTKVKGIISQGIEIAKARANMDDVSTKRESVSIPEPQDDLSEGKENEKSRLPDTLRSQNERPPDVMVVKEGDTLENLVKKVYGTATPEHMKQLLDANPHISNSKRIFPGQKVVFPQISTPSE